MYEQHFGLQKRPFNVKATGTEVFVGPQTAKTMAGFRKALAARDAVVTVSGAAGTGKTTLVDRSLDAIGSKYKTIRVGRMQMNASDVLESLLIVLGVQDRPSGTIQRFTALRRKLRELQDAETRVFILVEDALRAGTDTLAELEALTVADAGESDGASIVLMGDERLFEYMKEPQLAQLQQRVRQRHRIQPLCIAELRGYLRHGLRLAGGDFDQLFDARSAELLHGLCDGIPRVANNIVEAVLTSAASQGLDRISASFIASVAEDEFGLTVDGFDFSMPEEEAAAKPPATDESAPAVDAAQITSGETHDAAEPQVSGDTAPAGHASVATPAPVAEMEPEPEPTPAASEDPVVVQDPVIVFADGTDEPAADSTDIPHLIQDTLPDLAVLSARYATLEESYIDSPPDSAAQAAEDDAVDNIPELQAEPLADPELKSTPATPADPSGEQTPVDNAPETATTPRPDVPPEWELTQEPEFELVTEVVPSLNAEVTGESGATTAAAQNDIPELKVELDPAPVADDIPELPIEPEPLEIARQPVAHEPVAHEPIDHEPIAHEPIAEKPATKAVKPEAATKPKPAPVIETAKATQDASAPDIEPGDVAAEEEVAEWDRDPTLAQLKPDLDALEQALAFTHGEPAISSPAVAPEELAKSVAELEELPEIILDKSIETGIDNLDIEEPADIQPPKPVAKPNPELDRIAADIANAKSIEDIDDIMAETLFGTGISMIAAQVTANPPQDDSANDELQLMQDEATAPPPVTETPTPVATNGAAPTEAMPDEEISIETKTPVANTGLDLSASQRLKTVRALNAHLHPSLREPGNEPDAAASGKPPQPIEDQINTSITQTLKALKVPPEVLDDEAEEEPKKGFLSRFRRS
ncbi:MAG: AAA family ATPase [Woeseiaceae bacterium]